ncbi:sulfatase family protein [Anaerobaca lacustris]|uniref:Sulfatase n=1 Tax=Anaerobaca lacustris TaxID=3044600 RepID=A0AAW6TZ83_9BACT|nr:sulfatase [Sedimentisphaerales bacterium M17dextr]
MQSNMNRRGFLRLSAGAAALASFSWTASHAGASKRPNVVVIVSDDHGRGDLGCYGNPVVQTPHLDALAAEGVRFTNAFCTTASCSASRSVILSGLYNHYNGQYGHEHSYHHFRSFDHVRSLPVLLTQAGYRTARIGKYHVAPEEVYRFDVALPGGSRSPVRMADNCKAFVASGDAKPFFLYFCMSDPHRGGGKAADLPHEPDRFGNRDQGYPGVKEVTYDPEEIVVPDYLPDIPECRAELAQYYQSVSRVDQGVGRLIEVLKQAGQYDNTIVIYISDNGIAFAGAKTTLYEPGMNLPCIVRTPWQKNKGIACDALVNYADLTPTILDFAGATPGDYEFHGRSFQPVLERRHADGWDTTYASHTFHEITMYYPMRVVRERRFKLIWNIAHGLEYPFASDLLESATWQGNLKRGNTRYGRRTIDAYLHRPRFELYDLQNDPHEVVNLADDPDHQARLNEMKARLKAFQEQTKDPWILKWEYE